MDLYNYLFIAASPFSGFYIFRMALGNLPEGPPVWDKFVLSNEAAQWSIWNPNFKSGAERMKVKEEAERMKRNTCGAFMVRSLFCFFIFGF